VCVIRSYQNISLSRRSMRGRFNACLKELLSLNLSSLCSSAALSVHHFHFSCVSRLSWRVKEIFLLFFCQAASHETQDEACGAFFRGIMRRMRTFLSLSSCLVCLFSDKSGEESVTSFPPPSSPPKHDVSDFRHQLRTSSLPTPTCLVDVSSQLSSSFDEHTQRR
jgi:hypothetical protein